MKRNLFPALVLAGLLTLPLSLPCLAEEDAEAPGPGQVPGAEPWYAQAQSYVMEHNIMSGQAEGFDPYRLVNRATMIQALWNMEGRPLETDVARFADVAVTAWYQDSAAWAQNAWIAQGDGMGNFNPQGAVTRGEMATLLYRYAQYKGRDVYSVDTAAAVAGYLDAPSLPDYAAAPIGWAVSVGVMNGRSTEAGQQLDHSGTATRAELATVLMRMDRIINGGEDLTPSAPEESGSPAPDEALSPGEAVLPPDAVGSPSLPAEEVPPEQG